MAVDFYKVEDREQISPIFSWTDADFNFMKDVLALYQQKTGLIIDQYGTTRIHQAHIQLLLNLLDECKPVEHHAYIQWSKIRNQLSSIVSDIVAVGD